MSFWCQESSVAYIFMERNFNILLLKGKRMHPLLCIVMMERVGLWKIFFSLLLERIGEIHMVLSAFITSLSGKTIL